MLLPIIFRLNRVKYHLASRIYHPSSVYPMTGPHNQPPTPFHPSLPIPRLSLPWRSGTTINNQHPREQRGGAGERERRRRRKGWETGEGERESARRRERGRGGGGGRGGSGGGGGGEENGFLLLHPARSTRCWRWIRWKNVCAGLFRQLVGELVRFSVSGNN